MMPIFSPHDKPRKHKPAAGSPEEFERTLTEIESVVADLRGELLYPTVYELGYSNVKTTFPELERGSSRGELTHDGHADPGGDFSIDLYRQRYRDLASREAKTVDHALRLLRTARRSLRSALGSGPGRKNKWAG